METERTQEAISEDFKQLKQDIMALTDKHLANLDNVDSAFTGMMRFLKVPAHFIQSGIEMGHKRAEDQFMNRLSSLTRKLLSKKTNWPVENKGTAIRMGFTSAVIMLVENAIAKDSDELALTARRIILDPCTKLLEEYKTPRVDPAFLNEIGAAILNKDLVATREKLHIFTLTPPLAD